ncbi:Ubiquitin--protein ligase [Bertholletia excelsa]
MIGKSDAPSRRILTFPAIRPCEAVAPATLLDSLIVLASNISRFRSESIFSNKRNARESIRVLRVLLAFFEEIKESQFIFSDSMILSLSELHFIFQKLRFLLEDCARDGSRLWMLVNCDSVACQFRVLMKGASTAIDVLPLNSIKVSLEALESIELVMKQLRKSRFEVDIEDRLAKEETLSLLKQFQLGIVPKRDDLRKVLDQLGIRSWRECHREIKFLDSEIILEHSSPGKRGLQVLSSLVGLVSYCRVTLFDAVDEVAIQRSTSGSGSEVVRHLSPDDFRCPISLEIMTDPVVIGSGHTYDRSSILRWFKAGHRTCPKTGENLASTELAPNLAVKRLISQYCYENGISFPVGEKEAKKRDITWTIFAGSEAAESCMKAIAKFLLVKLATGTDLESNKAAFEIRLLTKSSIFNRSCLAETGTIPHLLNLLSSPNSSIQENAIAALLNLSKHSKSKAIMVENGGVESILRVLKEGVKMEARQHSAGTLFYLASVEKYRALIGETPGAIAGLMELLRDGTGRGKKNALVAIFGLLMCPDNHWRVLSAGLIPLLSSCLINFQGEDIAVDSLAVLATIAEKQEGTIAIIGSGVLPMIVEIFCSTNSRAGKEFCVSILLDLCINGGRDVVPVLIKNPSLMGQLYSLLTEGTSRASKKASSLIRLLLQFQGEAHLQAW